MNQGVTGAKFGLSPSMKDIAKAARVSVATASLALNNHRRVAARTKERVLRAASKLGFVPNHAARRLIRTRFAPATDPFDHAGFVFFDSTRHDDLDGVYLPMLLGTEKELARSRASLLFSRVSNEEDRVKVSRLVKAGWVDGWLVTGIVSDEALELVRGGNRPCVVLGGHRCAREVNSVDVDFVAVGHSALRHLAALGHRRIGFLGGSMKYPYQQDVLRGFRTSIRELGLDDDDALIVTLENKSVQPLVERLNDLLAVHPRPTAIFTAEPNYAMQVIGFLRQLELQIPGEISVLGCEIDGRSQATPGFSRIETPFSELGRAGAALLKEMAEHPVTTTRQVRISPNLVEGWSCGRPKANGTEPTAKTISEDQTRKEIVS